MADTIMRRQIVEAQFGLDQETETVVRHGPLRPAWGSDTLAHFAEYMDEAVPASTPVMDWLFGERMRIVNHDEEWWRAERPRPYRGETADPSIPAAERAEYEARQRELARLSADEKERKEIEERERQEAIRNKQDADFEILATAEAQKRRLAFFGRPAQKFTLKKRQCQLDRNEWEQQAAMFLHLFSDAKEEYEVNQRKNKDAKTAKNKAANLAASYRAEERGARAAAKGLSVGGRQLEEAKRKAADATEKYAALAAEQEAIARVKRHEEEEAQDIMEKEDEKRRVCKGQIKFLKSKAKEKFLEAAANEVNEIKALVAEKLLLKDFKAVWEAKKVPRPQKEMKQSQIDMYDEREDRVSMEMRMFVHMYTQKDKDPDDFNADEEEFPPHFKHKLSEKGPEFDNLPDPQDLKWIEQEQKPGTICLGRKGRGPVLANRKKVVSKAGVVPPEIEKDATKKKKWQELDVDEEVCEDIGKSSAKPVILDPARLAEGNSFISRAGHEEGLTKSDSELTPDLFQKLWGDDPRHKVIKKIDSIKVVLRHPPNFRWLCTWVPKNACIQDSEVDGKKAKYALLDLSKVLLPREPVPFKSFNLGPQRKAFKEIRCPGLHPQDMPDSIRAADQQPRLKATVEEWTKGHDEMVEPGDEIAIFTVIDVRKNGDKKKFVPEVWLNENGGKEGEWYKNPENAEKYNRCEELYLKDDTGAWTNRICVKATAAGKLTGMMRDEGSTILSFDEIASIDVGDPGWRNVLLPVAEWP